MPTVKGYSVKRDSVTALTRDAVASGVVFKVAKKGCGWGKNNYAALDRNGKNYSINLETGALASTENGGSKVKVTGKWNLVATMLRNGARTNTTRNRVVDNQLYIVKGKNKVYAHVGTLSDGRFFSLVVGNTDNHATGTDGRKAVTIVGSYNINVELTEKR